MEDVMVDLQLRVPCADLGALVAQLTGLGHEVKVVVLPRPIPAAGALELEPPAPVSRRALPPAPRAAAAKLAKPAPAARGKASPEPSSKKPTHCANLDCGKRLKQPKVGRWRTYCSSACRPSKAPPAPASDELPPRRPQEIATGGPVDPLKRVVELPPMPRFR